MPDDSSSHSGYAHVPILTKDNYHRWQIAIKAYLRPGKHLRVIKRGVDATGATVDPAASTDPAELEKWENSEGIAMGVIITTATKLHLELVIKYEDDTAWSLWSAIEASHVTHDASTRREAWVYLFGMRKREDESYPDYYRRGDEARNRLARVTPASQTPQQRSDELLMTTILYGLPVDDPLRRQFVSQSTLSLEDMWTAFISVHRDATTTAAIESANGAFAGACIKCDQRSHLAKECPYAEVIKRTVNTRIDASKKKGKGRANPVANAADAGSSAAFTSSRPDRRPTRLADGR